MVCRDSIQKHRAAAVIYTEKWVYKNGGKGGVLVVVLGVTVGIYMVVVREKLTICSSMLLNVVSTRCVETPFKSIELWLLYIRRGESIKMGGRAVC